MRGMDEAIGGLILLAIALAPIWVFIDAPKHGMTRAWALGVLLFWIPTFPLYLLVRAGAKRRSEGAQRVQQSLQPAHQVPGGGARAGWLPDPWFPGRFRYWDGTRWTSNSSNEPK
jgi:Protein of unknown function (DUF2510)